MTTKEFFNSVLPPHLNGALGMLNTVRNYGIENDDDKLVTACNKELANFN